VGHGRSMPQLRRRVVRSRSPALARTGARARPSLVQSLMMLTKVPSPVKLANELRPLLLQINRQLRRELAPLGITGGQAAILHAIQTSPGVGVRQLAAREGVSAPAMSGYVDRLEAAGLARRLRLSDDRRRVGLELTPAGARVLRSARSRRTAWLAARLERLEPEELAALAGATAPLRRLLEAGQA
jgi:DNA-binding MarR family transcriptional regulator